MDKYTDLSKTAIREYLAGQKILEVPANLPREFYKKAGGVFVSLHETAGELRGCIGTFLPVRDNLAEEIINNAIAAATEDPRFSPIRLEELDRLKIEVSILSKPEACTKKDLNPRKYGIIIGTDDGRKGLLLPDLPGISHVDEQIAIAAQKGGIARDEKMNFFRFTTTVHK